MELRPFQDRYFSREFLLNLCNLHQSPEALAAALDAKLWEYTEALYTAAYKEGYRTGTNHERWYHVKAPSPSP